MANEHLKVIAGIDTHADTHHVAIMTETALRVRRAERATAMRARVAVMNQVQGILVPAPRRSAPDTAA